jgi:hypothetical protein
VTVHGFRSTFASWAEEAGFKESRTNNCNDFWKDRLFEAHVQKPIQLFVRVSLLQGRTGRLQERCDIPARCSIIYSAECGVRVAMRCLLSGWWRCSAKCSASFTMLRRSCAFLMRINDFARAIPSEVARKSAT